MRVRGLYTSIQEAMTFNNSIAAADYTEYVNPLDYDFYIEKNNEYHVVGRVQRGNAIWLYIFDDDEIQIIPSILFKWIDLECKDFVFYIGDNEQDIGVIHKKLSHISFWFERYIDEDEEVTKIVNDIFETINEK